MLERWSGLFMNALLIYEAAALELPSLFTHPMFSPADL